MSTLAVVRRTPSVSKRDLLLFDQVYVLDLEKQLSQLPQPELADVLYLMGQGVVKQAEVPVEVISEGPIYVPPSLHGPALMNQSVLRIAGQSFRLEVENYGLLTLELELDERDLAQTLPDGIERFAAASISESLGPLGHCTFLIENTAGCAAPDAFSGQVLLRTAGTRTPVTQSFPGVILRGQWEPEAEAPRGEGNVGESEWALFEAVIDSLPVPGDLVPLDAVLEFRDSRNERERLNRLARWIQRKILEGGDNPKLVRLEVEDAIEAYEAEMRAQRMVVRHERLRILMALPSSVIRAVLGSSAGGQSDVLTLLEHKVKLTQAEMAAPGRDLAYVAAARSRFQSRV